MKRSEYSYICTVCGGWVHILNRSRHEVRGACFVAYEQSSAAQVAALLRRLAISQPSKLTGNTGTARSDAGRIDFGPLLEAIL